MKRKKKKKTPKREKIRQKKFNSILLKMYKRKIQSTEEERRTRGKEKRFWSMLDCLDKRERQKTSPSFKFLISRNEWNGMANWVEAQAPAEKRNNFNSKQISCLTFQRFTLFSSKCSRLVCVWTSQDLNSVHSDPLHTYPTCTVRNAEMEDDEEDSQKTRKGRMNFIFDFGLTSTPKRSPKLIDLLCVAVRLVPS